MANIFANPLTKDFWLTNKTKGIICIGDAIIHPEDYAATIGKPQPRLFSEMGGDIHKLKDLYQTSETTRNLFDNGALVYTSVEGTTPLDAEGLVDRSYHTGTQTSDTISDFDDAVGNVIEGQKGVAEGIASLNADGKLENSQTSAIAITDTYVVGSEAAMLALSTADTGDVAVRTDLNKSFILKGTTSSELSHWQELLSPTDSVLSVNEQTGAVSLSTSHINEGTNQYFTEARARNSISVSAGSAITYSSSTGVISGNAASTSQDGYVSSTDWNTFNSKEPALSPGTTSQYYRGDKSWQTLNTDAVTEGTNQYFTNARAIGATLTGFTSGAGTITASDSILSALQKLQGNTKRITETSSYTQLGLDNEGYFILGKENDGGDTSVAYGSETFRYNLGFRQWRDISYNQIGARISSVAYNIYASGSAIDQSTALIFATSETSGGTGGTFTDNSIDRMRITPEGNFEFGGLSGSQSFFDIGKTKLEGGAHSDIMRVKHHTPLSDTINDLRVVWSAGVQTGGNNTALSQIVVRTANTLDWTSASLGLVLTVDNVLSPWGGQLMLSNNNGLGGIAINHNLAQARLHVKGAETYNSIFESDYASPSGITVVNTNTTGTSFIALSDTLATGRFYMEKIGPGHPVYPNLALIGSTVGDISVLIDNEVDILRIRQNKNISIKYNLGAGTGTDDLSGANSSRLTARQANNGDALIDAGWIAGEFGGGANNVGNRIVMGSASSKAIIGAHSETKNNWAGLYINPHYDPSSSESKLGVGISHLDDLLAVLNVGASNTNRASINLKSGTAPATPQDGDIWREGSDIKIYVGGVIKTFVLS